MLIYQEQFGMVYNPDLVWVAGTVCAMAVTVCALGYLACRHSLRVSVRDLLAE